MTNENAARELYEQIEDMTSAPIPVDCQTIIALALTAAEERGRKAEGEELYLVISNLLDVIHKHAIHGPCCRGKDNYCECGLLDALSKGQASLSKPEERKP